MQPELYTAIDKRAWILTPSFVRQRHRYRGPRESQKFNSEIMGFRFDITRLYEKYRSIVDSILECSERGLEGATINAKFINKDDVSPALEPFIYEGVNSLAGRIEALRYRVRELENR